MLETLLEHPFFLNRHRDAPLLNEREVFLRQLQQQGTGRVALWNLSGELIHVVRLLQMEKLREVSQEEIHRAAQRWARQQRSNPNAHSYGNSASFFIYAAKKWLCFHGRLKPSSAPRTRFADQLGDFALYMNRRTRAVSAVRPITLLEDVEVPELGWGAASIVGAGERRRRGRVSCDERRGRMESQVRFCGRAGAAAFFR
jgi:hypothetical protein